jgi:hypothetical protein
MRMSGRQLRTVILILAMILISGGAFVAAGNSGEKTSVGIFFKSDVYPNKDAKVTFYVGESNIPFLIYNEKGEHEIGEFRLPELQNVEYVAVKEEVFPAKADFPKWAQKYKIRKLIILNMTGKTKERVPLFSSQKYTVTLSAASYDCPSGNKIYEKSFSGDVQAYPSYNAAQVAEVCRSVFGQFKDLLSIFIHGNK